MGAGSISSHFDEAAWSAFLTARLGYPVRALFGHSRTAPVQARRGRGADGGAHWEIRLHRMFGEAPPDVREALVVWLRAGRRATRAGPLLDRWIHAELARRPAPRRRLALETAGDVHDLDALAARILRGEFRADFEPRGSAARPRISWGRRAPSRSRRSLRLGSFEPESRVVRIHPVLDQDAVPAWFVAFVLKHEFLHAVLDAYRDPSGRWVHHGPEFRAREASWPEYEPAVAWERRNLARLIRSAREGSRLQVRAADLVLPAGVEDPLAPLAVAPVAARDRRLPRAPSDGGRQPLLPFDDPE